MRCCAIHFTHNLAKEGDVASRLLLSFQLPRCLTYSLDTPVSSGLCQDRVSRQLLRKEQKTKNNISNGLHLHASEGTSERLTSLFTVATTTSCTWPHSQIDTANISANVAFLWIDGWMGVCPPFLGQNRWQAAGTSSGELHSWQMPSTKGGSPRGQWTPSEYMQRTNVDLIWHFSLSVLEFR